jgi:hypothetical protein
MVPEREPAVTNAAAENMSCTKRPAMERRSGVDPAVECGPATSDCSAMKRRPATMECAAATVEAATSVTTATTVAAAVATPTMTGDFDCRPAGSSFRRRQRARTNQRQSFGTMRSGRQHQHRGGREDNASRQATHGTVFGF